MKRATEKDHSLNIQPTVLKTNPSTEEVSEVKLWVKQSFFNEECFDFGM